MQELIDKLPAHIKINWAMYKQHITTPTDLSTLGNWLFDLAKATSEVTITSFNESSENKYEPKFSKDKKYINLHTNDTMQTNVHNCVICGNGQHNLAECEKFQQINRKQRL